MSTIEQILDVARWAPSGDNTQPWRFEVASERHAIVYGRDTRDHCVYDLDGHPSQMSIGALLETVAIAASSYQWQLDVTRRRHVPDIHPVFDLHFFADEALAADALAPSIPMRSVQRRSMQFRRLTRAEKTELEAAVVAGYRVKWLETPGDKISAARLMFSNAKLRLTLPEAFEVHKAVIEWRARYSIDRIPDQALGVDAMTARMMRFVMQSWPRVQFFNRWFAGTWLPRIQMDLWPSLACASHFLLVANEVPASIDDYVAAGRALQRFWLTATRLKLQLQPEMTPVIFSRYARKGLHFSRLTGSQDTAGRLARRLDELVGVEAARAGVFMGRVGAGEAPRARSTRLTVGELRQRL